MELKDIKDIPVEVVAKGALHLLNYLRDEKGLSTPEAGKLVADLYDRLEKAEENVPPDIFEREKWIGWYMDAHDASTVASILAYEQRVAQIRRLTAKLTRLLANTTLSQEYADRFVPQVESYLNKVSTIVGSSRKRK